MICNANVIQTGDNLRQYNIALTIIDNNGLGKKKHTIRNYRTTVRSVFNFTICHESLFLFKFVSAFARSLLDNN
jgi:predicted pyridoxine 5'-phosphate oxidase superfamily flavin-nucleotide-binding protein